MVLICASLGRGNLSGLDLHFEKHDNPISFSLSLSFDFFRVFIFLTIKIKLLQKFCLNDSWGVGIAFLCVCVCDFGVSVID